MSKLTVSLPDTAIDRCVVAVWSGAAHFAYSVRPAAGMVSEAKSNFCVRASSLYHPWNW